MSQMADTLLFLRLQEKEKLFPAMKLGICLSVNNFFAKVAYHVQVPLASILQMAIRLPVDNRMLDEYVLQVEAGNQSHFEDVTRILSDALGRLDSGTVPARYILTVTIAVNL